MKMHFGNYLGESVAGSEVTQHGESSDRLALTLTQYTLDRKEEVSGRDALCTQFQPVVTPCGDCSFSRRSFLWEKLLPCHLQISSSKGVAIPKPLLG
jgi:hypothetical protein